MSVSMIESRKFPGVGIAVPSNFSLGRSTTARYHIKIWAEYGMMSSVTVRSKSLGARGNQESQKRKKKRQKGKENRTNQLLTVFAEITNKHTDVLTAQAFFASFLDAFMRYLKQQSMLWIAAL